MQRQTTGKERVLGALARAAAGEWEPGVTIYLGRLDGYVLVWTRLHPGGEVDEFKQATSFLGASLLGASVTPPVSRGNLERGRFTEIAGMLRRAPFELREPAEPLRPSFSPHRIVVRLEVPAPAGVFELELVPPSSSPADFDRLAEALQEIVAAAGRAKEMPLADSLFEDELTVAGDASEVLAHLAVDEEKTFAGGPGGPFGQPETARQLARSLLSDVARTHAPALERARREGRDPRAAVASEVAEAWRTFSHLVPAELHGEFQAVAREVFLVRPKDSPR